MPMIEINYPVTKDMNLKEEFPVNFKFTEIPLYPDEKALLRKHGTVLYAFWDGTLIPFTPTQKHFVNVCKGIAEPKTKKERVWLKYIFMLEDEKRLKKERREKLKASPKQEEYLRSRYK